jgi:hypothetical protein
MRALLLALFLLAAPVAAQDISAGEVTVEGKRYTVIFRPVGDNPPPPTDHQVTGVRDAATGEDRRSAPGGTVIRVLGRGFGAVPGSVTWAGQPAPVRTWQPTEIEVTLPSVLVFAGGKVVVRGTDWFAESPFEVGLEPGTIAAITGYELGPGGTVRILGSGFGTRPGQVIYESVPVNVIAWTDTAITATAPDKLTPPGAFSVLPEGVPPAFLRAVVDRHNLPVPGAPYQPGVVTSNRALSGLSRALEGTIEALRGDVEGEQLQALLTALEALLLAGGLRGE